MESKDIRDFAVFVFLIFNLIFTVTTMVIACEIYDEINAINCINHNGKLYCEMK